MVDKTDYTLKPTATRVTAKPKKARTKTFLLVLKTYSLMMGINMVADICVCI